MTNNGSAILKIINGNWKNKKTLLIVIVIFITFVIFLVSCKLRVKVEGEIKYI